MPLQSSSRPRLTIGCRAKSEGENWIVIFPEGVLRLQKTARAVLERCDGERTFEEIIKELQALYSASDPVKIRKDAEMFLERLRERRVVDF